MDLSELTSVENLTLGFNTTDFLMLGFVAEQERNSPEVALPVIQFSEVGLKIGHLVRSKESMKYPWTLRRYL